MENNVKKVSLFSALLISLSAFYLLGSVNIRKMPLQSNPNCVVVQGNEAPYVPHTARYVKYNGKIKKIVKIEPYNPMAVTNCKCPNCCNGSCYIIIYTDAFLINEPIRMLAILWIDC